MKTSIFKNNLPPLLILLYFGIFFGWRQQHTERAPNIVFLLSDDHACEAISSYGSQLVETPHIDKLASEGMQFNNCFAVEAICRPSRTSILTGKYGHITGGTGWNFYDTAAHKTFPEYLRESGYQTALFGKFHIGTQPRGFDAWEILPGQGRYNNPELISPDGKKSYDGHISDVVVDLAIDWMDQLQQDRPFMVCINDKAVHMPFIPPDRWMHYFDDKDIEEPQSLFWDLDHPDHPASRCDLLIDSLPHWQRAIWGETPQNLDQESRRKWIYNIYMKYYLGSVKGIDENIGRFTEYLKEKGLYDNTIVIYSSDQGFLLGQKNLFDKRWMYDPCMRMPLIIRYPGVSRPERQVDKIVLNVDFAPTLMDIAGIPIPSDMQGKSLLPLIKGPGADWRSAMYYRLFANEYNVPLQYGIRTEKYKLIHFKGAGSPLNPNKKPVDYDHWELIDLKNDPDELVNHAEDPAYRSVRDNLQEQLQELMGQLGDISK